MEKYFKHYTTIDFDVKNQGELIESKDIFRNIRDRDTRATNTLC